MTHTVRNTLARLLVSETSESAELILIGVFRCGTSIWSLFFTSSRSMSPLSLVYPDELSRCRSASVDCTSPDSRAGAACSGGGSAEMLLSTSRFTATPPPPPPPPPAVPATETTTPVPDRDDSMSDPDCFNSMFSNSSPLTMTGEPATAETAD